MRDEPLSSHARFRGSDADALAAFLATKQIRLDICRDAKGLTPLDVRLNAVYLDGMYVSYVQYGSRVHLDVLPPRPDYSLSLPVERSFRVRLEGRDFDCGRYATVITSPFSRHSLDLSDSCRRIGISFACEAVVRQLSALLGDTGERAVVFDPAVDFARAPAGRLRRTLLFVIGELESDDGSKESRPWRRELEQLALTALLLNLPHNWSGRLLGPASPALPRDVKRAIDYIHAYVDQPLGLADIAAAAGVPGRTLLRHFRAFTGSSPFAYARAERMRRVRDDLRREAVSVTEVAARWGFTHFGRFAGDYRRLFGELPSETRRRGS